MDTVLQLVRDIVYFGWTKEQYAKKPDGSKCSIYSPSACQFCLSGALRKALGYLYDTGSPLFTQYYDILLNAANEETNYKWDNIPEFNDDPNTTKDLVLKVIDRALENS